MTTEKKIEQYIEENLPKCTRIRKEDDMKIQLYGLPHPYTVPSVNHFDELYYWDTYFLNQIFKFDGQWEQMKNNVDNILYMIERFGHMGNSNRAWHLKTSQPPFSTEMVKDVYKHYADKLWLEKAYQTLVKEYKFWMTERITEIGLNQYGCKFEEEDIHPHANCLIDRLGYRPDMSEYDMARQYLICCESGFDLCYRWGMEGYSYVQVDLNSLLYGFEKNMEYFSKEIASGEENIWLERAETRKELMNRYMLGEDNIFYDYSLKTKKLGIFTTASIYPLCFGLANEKQAKAVAENISRIELEHGVTICEKHDVKGLYQWAYPNAWPCMQYIAVFGFEKYGYTDIALRLAKKYADMVEKVFEETGELWEKYNALKGNNKPVASGQSTMLGWTAGTYLSVIHFMKEKSRD